MANFNIVLTIVFIVIIVAIVGAAITTDKMGVFPFNPSPGVPGGELLYFNGNPDPTNISAMTLSPSELAARNNAMKAALAVMNGTDPLASSFGGVPHGNAVQYTCPQSSGVGKYIMAQGGTAPPPTETQLSGECST